MSFGAIYGLSFAQTQNKSGNQLIISLIISVVIAVINVVLKIIIRVFTGMERSFTKADFNGSLAVKTTLAQLMNNILVLVIVGYFIKQQTEHIDVFQKAGLIEDIFMLSLTTTLLPLDRKSVV